MNIYLRELKAHRKSIILWTIFIFLFVVMGMQKYSSMYAAGTEEFMKIMDELPSSLKAIFGMNKLDITSLTGYYAVLHLYLLLMMGIHSSMLGANIISKEEKDKTSEFLMTKPITRNKVLTSKLLAGLSIVVFLNFILFLSILIVFTSLKESFSIYLILILNLGILFVQLIFMILGVLMATIKAKKSSNNTMTILIISFFLSIIIDVWDKLKILSIFTPFKYFDAKNIVPNNALNAWYILLTIMLTITMLYFSYKVYQKRDLQL